MAYTVFDALRAGFRRVVIVTRPPLRAPLEARLGEQLGAGLPLDWVYQDVAAVPEAHASKATARAKPWGTGQAVVACGDYLPGAFGIANGDDWYGPEALTALADALSSLSPAPPCRGVLVGFPMAATLPPGGAGVSRGWVQTRDGAVRSVLELRDTARGRTPAPSDEPPEAGGRRAAGGPITGTDPGGASISVPEEAWASMNLWGFGPCALPLLSSAFDGFLAREGEDPEAEFALSSAVDSLIADHSLSLDLLPEGRRWFGITHPGDASWVAERLRRLHDDGTYPTSFPDAVRAILSELAP
jgi:hypothetical protein